MRSFVLLVFIAGCVNDVDLSGIYRVSSEIASRPCGFDNPVRGGYAYVRLTRGELNGNSYFMYDGCTDEAGTDCASVNGLFGGFYVPIVGGWSGNATFADNNGRSCSLGMREQTALLDNDVLVIESHTYQDLVDLPEAECQPAEAEARGDAMPCMEHSKIEANRL